MGAGVQRAASPLPGHPAWGAGNRVSPNPPSLNGFDIKRRNVMIPNIHIHERLMFERAREREREIEHQHLLSSLPKPHHSVMQWVIATLNAFLVAPGMRMKRLEPSVECSVCSRMCDCPVV